MQLREYQEKFVHNIAGILRTRRKVVAQLATGGGKTICFCAIAARYIARNPAKSVVIIVHRKELLEQTRLTAYNKFGITCQPVVAGMRFIPEAQVYVCMVESLLRRITKLTPAGLVIIDECHIANFNKCHEQFPEQFIIGFSASPLSSSKRRPVNLFYEAIVCGVDIPDLIQMGALCQNITYAPKDVVDRLELQMKGDDFDEVLMGKAFTKPKHIENTLHAYERWALGQKTIIFNVNVFHSQEVTKAFVDAGYCCRHVDGTMDKETRGNIFAWFRDTPDAILCNVGIATTGFDEPTIECVVVNKATASMPLWLQMTGRGGRPLTPATIKELQPRYPYTLCEKSAFTIIDMGGNAITHGDWCNPRDWEDIFNNPPEPGKPTAAPVKSCPACDAIVPAGTRTCPHCGYVWASGTIPTEVELIEFVVVTKGIDVQRIIQDNKQKKLYFAFFEIGRRLAEEALKTIPVMKDEYAVFIAHKYFELGKEWTKANNKRFNQWHRDRAQEILFEQLKKRYPKWETELIVIPERQEEAQQANRDISFIGPQNTARHSFEPYNPNDPKFAPLENLARIRNLEQLNKL